MKKNKIWKRAGAVILSTALLFGTLPTGVMAEETVGQDTNKEELQQIVRAAVGKLPERERYVIQEIYFNGRAKTEIADGQRYKDQFAVTRTEDKAMYILRKDQSSGIRSSICCPVVFGSRPSSPS